VTRAHIVFDNRGEVVEYELRPPPRQSTGHQCPVDSAEDELELRALVGIAWERRGSPDFRAAIDAVVDWHDRRFVRAWERKQRSTAAVLQVLRATDPARGRRPHRDHDHHRDHDPDVADEERAA
jgi:hypothetical protein